MLSLARERRTWPTLAMSLLLFAALYYLFCLRYGVLEVRMEVPEYAPFKIYWAKGGSGYSESRAEREAVSPDRSVHRFLVRHPWFIRHFRLDPAPGSAPFRIEAVRMIALGSVSPSADGVPGSALVRRNDIPTFETDGTAAYVVPGGGDPQLEVAIATGGLRRPAVIGAVLFAVLALLHVPLMRPALALTSLIGRRRVFIGTGLALAGLWLLAAGVTRFSPLVNGIVVLLAASVLATALGPPRRAWLDLARPLLAPRQIVTVGFLVAVFGLGIRQLDLYPDLTLAFNRLAAQRDDAVTMVRDLPEALNGFFKHNFRPRELLLHANAMLKIRVFRTSPTSTTLLGTDGFFFEGYGERRVEDGVIRSFDNVTDYLGLSPFGADELKQWATTLVERRRWLAERGIPYVFALAPTKGLVYPEYLPRRLQELDDPGRPSRFEQLVGYLARNTDLAVADLKEPLVEGKAKAEDRLLYYKSDFHWNFVGAFHAYRAIVETAAKRYPSLSLEPLSMDEFRVEVDRDWVHRRFLGTLGIIPDYFPGEDYIRLVPREDSPLWHIRQMPDNGIHDVWRGRETLTDPEHGSIEVDVIHNPAGKLDTIVVLGDSFIEKTLFFFAAHAKRTIFIRSVFQFRTGIFDFVQPDLVVQEILNMYLLRPPPVNSHVVAQ